MTASYRLNWHVFWPLATCGCTALLCLLQALRGQAGDPTAGPWDRSWAALLLKGSLLFLLLAYLAVRYRDWRSSTGWRGCAEGHGDPPRERDGQPRQQWRRRSWLEHFYEQQLRLSPHVLGHSKAHVSQVVGEVVRAGKAPGRLALRGDFVQVGSAYEQHKVHSPDGFDVIVPLRLPPRVELRVEPQRPGETGLRGAYICTLRVPPGVPDGEPGGGSNTSVMGQLSIELPGHGRHLSSALVLRWFHGHVQRCLGPVRSRLQERCRVSLAMAPGRPLTLHIVPCSDYVCCHLSMAVHLIPAIPLGEALYLTPLPSSGQLPAKLGAFWTLNASRQEQRLLGWIKDQAPGDSCHLKCLQILKGLRDLGGRTLDPALEAQWSKVLSSSILKTALLWLLLRGPLHAWEDQYLVKRLEDAVMFLVEGLQRRTLLHVFFGNPGLPEALSLPKVLKEASPVNLLADFEGPTLDWVAVQLLNTWKQAPKIIRMYSSHRYRRKNPV